MAFIINALRPRSFRNVNVVTPIICSRWASSAEHTLQVKQDICLRREASKQGGGAKRIAGQHKKVCFIFHKPVYVLIHIFFMDQPFFWYLFMFFCVYCVGHVGQAHCEGKN